MEAVGCRIVLAHGDAERREQLAGMLERLGHEVVIKAGNQNELVGAGICEETEVIVTAVHLEEGDGIEALLEIEKHGPRPAVVISDHEDLDEVEKALSDHVMAYLAEPVTEDDLRPTIHLVRRRFEQFEELRREVDDLREALAARKVIERAKGRLMDRHALSEEDAYRKLQKLASSKRIKLIEVAKALLLADEVEDELEADDDAEPPGSVASS